MAESSPPSGLSRRVFLETFGCQMNELDSELVRGQLAALGYSFTDDPHAADVMLYNTCAVREQAENKAFSRVGRVGVWKEQGRKVVLGVIGCVPEREGEAMIRKYPQIDLLCGPGELDRLPLLIDNALRTEAASLADRVALQGNTTRRSAAYEAAQDNLEALDLSRAFDPDRAAAGGRSAYVRITRGCNKFCSYCVVPNTRGPEIHRPPDAIVDECKRMADGGVIEVTLLGQTVNHYRYVHGLSVGADGREAPQFGPGGGAFRAGGSEPDVGHRVTTFADLLNRIHDEVPSIRRLRFVTSYPRDFGDDILQVMAECPRICRYLHLPAQSGSNRILKLMNRGYTVEDYLDLARRARRYLPDVSLAGDFIVGFSSETEEDFEQTRQLLRQVRFKNSFIFKYSPRPGTAAFDRMPDDVPDEVKRRRNNELLALQAEVSAAVHGEYVGRTVEVFVEQVSEKARKGGGGVELGWTRPDSAERQMSGRTGGDLITVFDLPDGMRPEGLLGQIVPVRVEAAAPLLLVGSLLSPTERAGPMPLSGDRTGQ
ncbi:MAG: MiaB/RimO family radical SAM methylthiotransferase [Phycisphaerales bacterium]|nr:MAG: MiaB/RimO family radical SAM methylthiotransferase [Phycisphaerales bacterium]